MTTLDDLVRALEQQPGNPIVAAMLTEELMDARDMTRSEADRVVLGTQLAATSAMQIREATALLSDLSTSRRVLLSAVYRACRVPRMHRPHVLVVDGWFLQINEATLPMNYDRYWGHVVILAGAGWLLRCHREYREHVRQLRRAARTRRQRR